MTTLDQLATDVHRHFAERIRVATTNTISARDIFLSKCGVSVVADTAFDRMLCCLETYVHSANAQHVSIHRKWPKDWWQAFKEQWFPDFLKKRFPVKYEKVDVEKAFHTTVCPHLFTDPQRTHLEWLSVNAPDLSFKPKPLEQNVLAAIKRAIDGSVPYVAAHGAFLISAEDWRELASIVNQSVAKLDAILKRIENGERPTEEEIQEALK